MYSGDGPDEFGELYGWRPPVKRSEIETFSYQDAAILLDGDAAGHGFHRYGSGMGKTEFPEGWGENEVLSWIQDIVNRPLDGFADGRGFRLFGQGRALEGVVVINPEGRWVISTAYPVSGVTWKRWKNDLAE